MERLWIALGALAGASAVALSALRAHALTTRLGAEALVMVDRALTMQGWHALALVLAGLLAGRAGLPAHLAGACFAAGMLLFCGAVYAYALGGVRIGPVAPVGGTLLILGWLALGAAAFTRWTEP